MNIAGGGLFYSVEKELPSVAFRLLLLSSSPQRNELDLLTPKPDLELIAGLQAQLGGVGLADHQVARGIYMPLLLLNANLIAMSQTKEVTGQRHRFGPLRFC